MDETPSSAMVHWTHVMSKIQAHIESQGGQTEAMVFDSPETWNKFLKLNAQNPTTNKNVVAFTKCFSMTFTDPNDRDYGSLYEPVAYPCLDIVVYCLDRGIRMTGTDIDKMVKILHEHNK